MVAIMPLDPATKTKLFGREQVHIMTQENMEWSMILSIGIQKARNTISAWK